VSDSLIFHAELELALLSESQAIYSHGHDLALPSRLLRLTTHSRSSSANASVRYLLLLGQMCGNLSQALKHLDARMQLIAHFDTNAFQGPPN